MTHHAVATPAGETYALSGARRYRWEAVGSTDPAEQNFGYQMVTRHAPDGTPTATALFGQPWPDGTPSAIAEERTRTWRSSRMGRWLSARSREAPT